MKHTGLERFSFPSYFRRSVLVIEYSPKSSGIGGGGAVIILSSNDEGLFFSGVKAFHYMTACCKPVMDTRLKIQHAVMLLPRMTGLESCGFAYSLD